MATLGQRRRALQAADELLNDLGVDQEAPIDVFNIVAQLGLWLVFNPLKTLLGAVVPKGDGGIMLTTMRQPAVQRYTAAHEIAHWTLDIDQLAFDTEDDIFYPAGDRERLAQLFAGQLLMPPPLVFAMCDRYGVSDTASASSEAVYSIARDMGASYEAAARQLRNLNIITLERLDQLLIVEPARIKASLCHGHRPTGYSDVWPVDQGSDQEQIHVTEGDEVFIALPENRSTGYRWFTADELRSRAGRIITAPPDAFGDDTGPVGTATPPLTRSRTIADVRRVLARVPGEVGARRTLPSLDQGPAVDSLSALDPTATLSMAPGLQLVDDRYKAGWATVPPGAARNVRRAIAGRNDVPLPDAIEEFRNLGAVDDTFTLDTEGIPVAATGQRLLALRANGDGRKALDLSYTSAFDPRADTVESFHLDVIVTPTPQVQQRRGLLDIDLDDGGGESK